jgi:transposase
VQRGDPKSGHRALSRRLDDQDRRPGRCAGQSRAVRPAAGVAPLLTELDFSALLADKAFDSDAIRADLADRGAIAVIPPKANRVTTIPCDFEMYKWRHLVENFFCKIKEFRRIATRYDKTDTSFSAMINLVGTVLATR